jgi:hypothetical protein
MPSIAISRPPGFSSIVIALLYPIVVLDQHLALARTSPCSGRSRRIGSALRVTDGTAAAARRCLCEMA